MKDGFTARRRGTGRSDTLFGTNGDDSLFGLGGDDLMFGGPGRGPGPRNRDDWFDGGRGNDIMHGGGGRDVFVHGAGTDSFYGGAGIDTADYSRAAEGRLVFLNGPALNALHDALYGVERLIGTRFDDELSAALDTHYAVTMFGGRGDDEIIGSSRGDRLSGDAGSDRIDGNEGNDRLYGGAGADTLQGLEGRDEMYGGAGADVLRGFDGYGLDRDEADTMYGGSGRDRLEANPRDVLFGGAGADVFELGYHTAGQVEIGDFDTRRGDVIDLYLAERSFAYLMSIAETVNGDTILDLEGDFTLVIRGVDRADLRQDDFSY